MRGVEYFCQRDGWREGIQSVRVEKSTLPDLKSRLILRVAREAKAYLDLEVGFTRGKIPDRESLQKEIKRERDASARKDRKITNLEKELRVANRKVQTLETRLEVLAPPEGLRVADRLSVFKELLSIMPPGRLLDLACGHGKFSLVARDLGWKVTAVDARTQRMPMTEGVEWVQCDVRSFEIDDGYDCISVLGLLYHLELPAQLELLRKCSGTPLVLDTHVSLHPNHEELGYSGSLFEEAPGADTEQHATIATASWGNKFSFWPTEGSLIKMLNDSGFSSVFKMTPPHTDNRTFYLCL